MNYFFYLFFLMDGVFLFFYFLLLLVLRSDCLVNNLLKASFVYIFLRFCFVGKERWSFHNFWVARFGAISFKQKSKRGLGVLRLGKHLH